MGNDLIVKATIEELYGHRQRSLEHFQRALDSLKIANEAHALAAPSVRTFGSHIDVAYSRRNCSLEDFRKEVDTHCWRSLLISSSLDKLMSAEQKRKFEEQLEKDVPHFEPENIRATFSGTLMNPGHIFHQSILDVFERAPRSYKSNDGFKIGSRMVLTGAINTFVSFSWSYGNSRFSSARDYIIDLQKIMKILDKNKYEEDEEDDKNHEDVTALAAEAMRQKESEVETEYFRLRWFKNGNLHVYFKREDLVRKMNRILADHFGEVLAN